MLEVLKINKNPPVSWPEDLSISQYRGTWWVAHTKSRNEKALANELAASNISYFLPMITKVRRISGRTIKSVLPIFSGYLFFCGDYDQRFQLLRTNRVANVIEVKDQEKLIEELLQIERAINAGVSLKPHKYIKEGQLCRITGGGLAGMQGIVVQTKSSLRLVMNIDILGKATSTEIDIDMVELMEG